MVWITSAQHLKPVFFVYDKFQVLSELVVGAVGSSCYDVVFFVSIFHLLFVRLCVCVCVSFRGRVREWVHV